MIGEVGRVRRSGGGNSRRGRTARREALADLQPLGELTRTSNDETLDIIERNAELAARQGNEAFFRRIGLEGYEGEPSDCAADEVGGDPE